MDRDAKQLSPNPATVLAVDDHRVNLVLLERHLAGTGLTVISVDNPKRALEIAAQQQPDLILLDVMMPGIDGYEVCRRLKADPITADIPIIFVSAMDDTADKVLGLNLGAVDYMTKPLDARELRTRVAVALEMAATRKKLAAEAMTDELTALANRRHLCEVLEREVDQAKVNGTDLALMMLDLDHFKHINDTYGHLGGDIVLKQFAEILGQEVYALDLVARYGGEEFVIVMPGADGPAALKAAERIRQATAQCHWKMSIDAVIITVSVGVCTLRSCQSESVEDLLKSVDKALYAAKRNGRNRTVCWEQIQHDHEPEVPEQADDIRYVRGQVADLSQQLRRQMLNSVSALTKALEAKDPFTAQHSENVRTYALAIAHQLQLPDDVVENLEVAARLHDLGKISVPGRILNSTEALSVEDRQLLWHHPVASVEILQPLGLSRRERLAIMHHHERFDGGGYPDGLSGNRIPIGARILAVADAFDAITSDRAHRSSRTCEEALDEIADEAGGQFDPEIVSAFILATRQHASDWPLTAAQCVRT